MRLGADQNGPAALGPRILGQHAEPAGDLLVSLQHAAHVTAEAILIELVGCGCIPQPAAIRAYLVGKDDAHLVVLPEAAELDLEVDEADADPGEEAGEEIVDPERQGHDLVDLLGIG